MLYHAIRVAELVAVLGTVTSIAYYLACAWSAKRFLRHQVNRAPMPQASPPVSILKPLKGSDPEIYESFRSHCLQDYVQYEIIFGVSDPADPAIELVEKLQNEFPDRDIRVVVCHNILGTNVKVSNLAQMLWQAKHDVIIVNDSDIRVPPDYIRRIAAALTDPQVGMVTCLYRGIAARTLGSRLESLGISTDFAAGVLLAQQLEGGLHFGLGSTLAVRRHDLSSIGGFEALVDYLADDYELGARIANQGSRVKLAEIVVETFLPVYSLRDFIEHQLRWGRTIRDSRPWGYFGLVTTFGFMWSLLALILAKAAGWACALFLTTLLLRLVSALLVGRNVLRDRQVVRFLYLLPLRDLMAVLIWIASFLGHTVRWRGDVFRLKNGRLVRISA
jgi:ceramide glucosyltransferase